MLLIGSVRNRLRPYATWSATGCRAPFADLPRRSVIRPGTPQSRDSPRDISRDAPERIATLSCVMALQDRYSCNARQNPLQVARSGWLHR